MIADSSSSPFDYNSTFGSQATTWLRARLNYRTGSAVQNSELNIWSSSPVSLDLSQTQTEKSQRLFRVSTKASQDDETAKVQPPEVVILFMPGNPGMVEFYQPFLNTLFNNLNSSSISNIVISSSHLSHYIRTGDDSLSQRIKNSFQSLRVMASNLNASRLFKASDRSNLVGEEHSALEKQVNYHNKVFESVYSSFDYERSERGPQIVLIGHSVGAYIATKVLERNGNKISHMIGLFPTISEIGKTRNAAKLKLLFSPLSLPVVNFLQFLVGLTIPKALLVRMLQRTTGYITIGSKKNLPTHQEKQDEFNSNIIANLLIDAGLTTNVLQMARSEMKTIKELDLEFLKRFKSQMTFYYTEPEKDHWIREEEFLKVSDIFGAQESLLFLGNQDISKPSSSSNLDKAFKHSCINRKIDNVSKHTDLNELTKGFGSNVIRGTEEVPHAFCLGLSPFFYV
ncbi:hypothetical protein BY996DRAFT_4572968 [Phakopsora pachyrhizi]|uniref:Lipid droplet-associated hydrolase n=1 Tax=Phakopsora pachyrhizi TaxID=170000 RepID=A0AAV0BL33_PHAPC|nr:hypothetical protein BY996DRAFT_4572968 [Phakopsora pachyrhizi]CAH7687031.1 hypothetical protein PPACK8108_LOCUS21755 [Phakopsora pachyrhizi]